MKDGLKKEELIGRQSGSVEWRKARGEIGASSIITTEEGQGQEKEEMEMFKKSSSGMKRMKFLTGGGDGSSSDGGGEWKLNGTARIQHQNDGMLLLTPAKNDCVGSAFYLKEKIDLKKSFRIGFSFRINGNQNGGADGMAFVLQEETSTAATTTTSTMGQGGSGLGYHGLKGRAVAVEIDTYASVDRCNDPNSNHISVQQGPVIGKEFQLSSHHDYSVAVCEQLPSLNNGSKYFVVVEYLSQKDEFNVYFTDSAEEKDYVRIIRIEKAQSKIVLLQQQQQEQQHNCWFGFTAATGGLCQEHVVLDFCYEQY
jgi:peptide-N4-(N-acetyl-beta-glucosaminyl)asparagine amidase